VETVKVPVFVKKRRQEPNTAIEVDEWTLDRVVGSWDLSVSLESFIKRDVLNLVNPIYTIAFYLIQSPFLSSGLTIHSIEYFRTPKCPKGSGRSHVS